jgi:4-amino-4-deoxy-L-arabinose transferase-like glycosyltransferase
VIPGCIAAVLALLRARRSPDGARVFLAVWALLPVLVFGFSSARSARYVFPILVPLALLTGELFVSWKRRAALLVATRIVPALLVALAAVLWIRPPLLSRDQSAAFKRAAADIQALVPPGIGVPLWGPWSWRLANPFVYYAERGLEPLGDVPVDDVLHAARRLPAPALVAPRERLQDLHAAGVGVEVFAELGDWVLVTPVVPPARADSGTSP